VQAQDILSTVKTYSSNNNQTPKVGASFIIKTHTNRADRISAVGDWTKFERTFALDYQQPSPFGISAMSIFRGYANKFINPVQVRNSGSAYQANSIWLLGWAP
jgi:hypothetical protein